MEMAPSVQAISSHAALLMAYLNLQREQAQFCDCVLRQKQSTGQLYPAHRCVLAASSPVLASILSSSCALVELQAPCLSDFVLAPLLDYVYTGTVPFIHSQQQYDSLLTAAHYLQMDELQKALRAWHQTEVSAADHKDSSTEAEDINNTGNTFRDLPPKSSIDVFRRHEETDNPSVQSTTASLERTDHQYSANAETFDETDMHSDSTDYNSKDVQTGTKRKRDKNGAKHCSTTDASTSSNAGSCCSIPDSNESNVNTGNYRQVIYLTHQNMTSTAGLHDMSGVDKEVQKEQFHSAASGKPEIWQRGTVEQLVRTTENGRSSSSSSSSSPHPCCGAVPVIRHSSRAAILQVAEVSAVASHHPASQASFSSSRAPVSLSASPDDDSIVEGIKAKHNNQCGAQNQGYTCNKKHPVTTPSQVSLNQGVIQDLCYTSSADRSDVLKQDYNSSNTDQYIMQNDNHVDNGLSHITDHNIQHAYCDSFQSNTQHLWGHSAPQVKDKTDLSFDYFPSKHRRLDCFECYDVSLATATKEHLQVLRAVVPLPLKNSDTGSDSHCRDLCPKGEVKEEHSGFSRHPAETDTQGSHCNLYGTKNWHSNTCRADTSTEYTISSQPGYDSNNRHTATENKGHSVDLCLPISTTPETSLDDVAGGLSPFECRSSVEPEKLSGTEITESRLTFTAPVDSSMSDTTYSAVGQSYHGHLHYHCLPQEDTHISCGGSDHKHSHPSLPDHSEESSGEEEFGTFASSGHSPLKQHFTTETADQVLLLDISTNHAELFVSCKHRSDTEKKGVGKKDTCDTGIVHQDIVQRDEAASATGVEREKNRARAQFQAESFDEAQTHSRVGQTNVEGKKPVAEDQSRPEAEVIQKVGVTEVDSNPKEDENQISTWTACSPPRVSDFVQASMSSTLSVCMPSTLSASTPRHISTHLSTPIHHPFQCSLCDRSFSQRGSLNRHVRSHLGLRPFPCPRCPMTFSRQYRVTEHMRVHQRCIVGNDFHKPPASSV